MNDNPDGLAELREVERRARDAMEQARVTVQRAEANLYKLTTEWLAASAAVDSMRENTASLTEGYPSVTECPSCSGTGEHSDWEFLPRCPTCGGTGEVPADDDSYPSVTHVTPPPKKRRWWERSPEAVEAFDFNIRQGCGDGDDDGYPSVTDDRVSPEQRRMLDAFRAEKAAGYPSVTDEP